jgi:hypothetical protein
MDREAVGHIDRLLIEMAVDRQELIAAGRQNSEMQKGLADVAEVVNRLQQLRQMLKSC